MTSKVIDNRHANAFCCANKATRRSIWHKLSRGRSPSLPGSTSGIGAGTARLFVAEGASVVIAGRRHDKGEQLAGLLGEAASFIRADVAVEADVEAMIGHALARFDRLDCLVNHAGAGSQRAGIADVDPADFDAAIAVHLRGAFLGMKRAAPVMIAQGSGNIINGASINGTRAGLGGHSYSAAKAAVIHLTRCAAVELGEKGIRVNSLSPGPIATGIFGKGAGLAPDDADRQTDLAEAAIAAVLPRWQPLPIVGSVDDIAQAALFLASDASRLISGHNLVVDGGISAGWPASVTREDIRVFRTALQAGRSMEDA